MLWRQALAKCLRRSRSYPERGSPYTDEDRIQPERSLPSAVAVFVMDKGESYMHMLEKPFLDIEKWVSARGVSRFKRREASRHPQRHAIPTSFRRRPPADCCSTRSAAHH